MAEWDDFNQKLIEEFRANGGVVGGQFAGAPLLILTTIGAKSGESRVSPLAYTRDGESLVIIASKGGAPTNPAWYYNLKANPEVAVEVGTETFQATASEPLGDERDRLFNQMASVMPGFAEYQKNTPRTIPVIRLDRIA
jgi:deazaflavin-dependent oxidoreductase (nitroreductase family)